MVVETNSEQVSEVSFKYFDKSLKNNEMFLYMLAVSVFMAGAASQVGNADSFWTWSCLWFLVVYECPQMYSIAFVTGI